MNTKITFYSEEGDKIQEISNPPQTLQPQEGQYILVEDAFPFVIDKVSHALKTNGEEATYHEITVFLTQEDDPFDEYNVAHPIELNYET